VKGLLADRAEALDDRCVTFTRLNVWPSSTALNWRGWLSNFQVPELRFARSLLEAFCYFGPPQTEALLRSAFHSISREVVAGATTEDFARKVWQNFLSEVIVTFVEGERPSPTDSGYAFARRARDLLGVPEDRVLFPDRALELVLANPMLPLVFVDDVTCSGQQFEKTWSRPRSHLGGQSFASSAANNVWYVPLIATWKGIQHIESRFQTVRLRPAHRVVEEYSAFSDKSIIWPDGSHSEARAFVEAASQRAGNFGADAWGFHGLGLSIAVNDSIPDCSLPLYYSTDNGWIPLMRRAS
jgi:hypothetical protein